MKSVIQKLSIAPVDDMLYIQIILSGIFLVNYSYTNKKEKILIFDRYIHFINLKTADSCLTQHISK